MRKWIVYLLIVFLSVFVGFNAKIADKVDANSRPSLVNGSFEGGLSGWDSLATGGKTPAEVEIDSANSKDGTKSARVLAKGTGITGLTQRVDCSGGDINISAWSKTDGESWLEVVQLQGEKPLFDIPFAKSSHIRKTTSWERLSVDVALDARTDSIEIHLFCKQNTTWFDGVEIDDGGGGEANSGIFEKIIDTTLAEPGTKLHLSIVCHVEPFKDYSNKDYFDGQVQDMKDFTDLLGEFGAKLTLQVQEPFISSIAKLGENPLTQLEQSGHEICTHFHENVYIPNQAPKAERKEALQNLKGKIDALGVTNLTLCGGWMWPDLPQVAGEVGFKYIDNYKNPTTQTGYEECQSLTPFRPSEDDFATNDPEGAVLYLPEGMWDSAEKPASISWKAEPEEFDRLTDMINNSLPYLELGKVNCANFVMHLSDFIRDGDTKLDRYRQYFIDVLGPAIDSGLIEFATISEAGKLYEDTQERGLSALPFVIVVVNSNYFEDEVEAVQAASNLRRQTQICQKYDLPTQHYFTWLSWQQTKQIDPNYLDFAKSNEFVSIHSHGANRPPNPSLVARMGGKNWVRDYNLAVDYETHAINPVTAEILDEYGGAKQIMDEAETEVMSCGRTVHGAVLKADSDLGFKVTVGLGDNSGASSNRVFMMNVLGRPDDIFIHPNDEFLPWTKGQFDLKAQLLNEIRKLDYFEPRFLTFVVHDWDMFRYKSESQIEKTWEMYDELIGWLVDDLGSTPSSIEQMYQMANHRGEIESSWVDAAAFEMVSNLDDGLKNRYGTDGCELTLTELLQGTFFDSGFEPVSMLGPTEFFDDVSACRLSSAACRDLLASVKSDIKNRESVPASFEVGDTTISAGQLLYVACLARVSGGNLPNVVDIPETTNYPETAYPLRNKHDVLQFWTYRPAHYQYLR